MKLLRKAVLLICFLLPTVSAICQSNIPIDKIPFKNVGNHMMVNVKVNDSGSLNFLFDTGVTKTIMNKRTADSLGLAVQRKIKTGGLNGKFKAEISKGNVLNLNRVFLENLNIEIASLSHLEEAIGAKIDGLLGYDLLKEFVAHIDNDLLELTLFDPKSYIPEKNVEKIEIPKGKLCFVKAKIVLDTGKELWGEFTIDSGSGIPVLLSGGFVKTHQLEGRLNFKSSRKFHGYAPGSTDGSIGKLNVFFIKDFKVTQIPVVVMESDYGLLATDVVVGVIGNPVLRKFNITFDYKNNRTFWAPNSHFQSIEFEGY